jgi:hypothetical protein
MDTSARIIGSVSSLGAATVFPMTALLHSHFSIAPLVPTIPKRFELCGISAEVTATRRLKFVVQHGLALSEAVIW